MSAAGLTDEQRIDWLRLIRSERVGPRTFRGLVNQHGGARQALEALPEAARRAGRAAIRIATRQEAEREIEALARRGGAFVASGEAAYPRALLATEAAPPLLAVRGDPAILNRPAVAIVGSRNASAAGGTFTERLAADLGRTGLAIVSGLARGIDTRAHRAALPTGTVAVLAGGHDRPYPAENVPLLERIAAEGGAVVSEMPLAWEPRARDFPRRNRIVSGLSYGTVVVEAARRSGSLITARFALEQGREVFAVPGSPLDPRAEGTNDLIRAGATLCAGADHVLASLSPLLSDPGDLFSGEPPAYRESPESTFADEELWDELDPYGTAPLLPLGLEEPADAPGPAVAPKPADAPGPADGDRGALVRLLGPSPVAFDDLARQAALPPRRVRTLLVELELTGVLEIMPGGLVALRA